MPVNIPFMKGLIAKHNDKDNPTFITLIQGTSMSNFFAHRAIEGKIILEGDDILWREPSLDNDNVVVTYRTGLNNIDMVSYIEDVTQAEGKAYEVGNRLDPKKRDLIKQQK